MSKRHQNYGGKEKRKYARRVIGVSGSIILHDGKRVPCEVSDISETGALLLLETPTELPAEFMLEISASAVRRKCRKMRQEGATAGVSFPDRPLQKPN